MFFRYIIEQTFGRLKMKFKYFARLKQSVNLTTIKEDMRIACAILNCQHVPILTDVDLPIDVAESMLSRKDNPNRLGEMLDELRLWRKRAGWSQMSTEAYSDDIPKLDEISLMQLSLGSYQMSLVNSYWEDNANPDGYNTLEVSQESVNHDFSKYGIQGNTANFILIRGRLRSRHTSSAKHMYFILLDKSKQGIEAFIEWCCSCKSGRRTISPCAHITTMIWWITHGRHEMVQRCPAAYLLDIVDSLSDNGNINDSDSDADEQVADDNESDDDERQEDQQQNNDDSPSPPSRPSSPALSTNDDLDGLDLDDALNLASNGLGFVAKAFCKAKVIAGIATGTATGFAAGFAAGQLNRDDSYTSSRQETDDDLAKTDVTNLEPDVQYGNEGTAEFTYDFDAQPAVTNPEPVVQNGANAGTAEITHIFDAQNGDQCDTIVTVQSPNGTNTQSPLQPPGEYLKMWTHEEMMASIGRDVAPSSNGD